MMLDIETTTVRVVCPNCGKSKTVKIPTKLVKESNHIITVSIPRNHVCEHSFHAYLDLNFQVRGYQDIDIDLNEMEIYETGTKTYELFVNYNVSIFLKNFIDTLIIANQKKEILGGVLFNEQGNLIHFSIPDEMLLKMIEQFQLQKNDENLKLKKFLLIFENEQKLLVEYVEIEDVTLIIGVLFPEEIELGECDKFLEYLILISKPEKDITKRIKKDQEKLVQIKKSMEKKESVKVPSNYWIYSKISNPMENASQIFIDSLDYKIDIKHVLNMEEIVKKSKEGVFEGKIFFSEKYIILMQGLAFTMKDAQTFMDKLNKLP